MRYVVYRGTHHFLKGMQEHLGTTHKLMDGTFTSWQSASNECRRLESTIVNRSRTFYFPREEGNTDGLRLEEIEQTEEERETLGLLMDPFITTSGHKVYLTYRTFQEYQIWQRDKMKQVLQQSEIEKRESELDWWQQMVVYYAGVHIVDPPAPAEAERS